MEHRIRVAGLVRNGDHILLVEQQNRFGKRLWSLPGGRLEAADADMFRGAEREVWEETGLRVKAGALRLVSEYLAPDMFALTLVVECRLESDEHPDNIHLNNTMEDDFIYGVRWWHLSEIGSAAHTFSRTLHHEAFRTALEDPSGVHYLGRHEEN